MVVGHKIRFFREIRGYTQAELGEKVGLQPDRIRQYENGIRTPKLDKLREIADALDVDIAAISYIDIGTEEDIMQIIFELEDQYKLHMQKIDGKAVLVFDDVERDNSVINTYLNFWYDKRQAFALESGNEARAKEYISWRGRFGSNEAAFEEGIIKKLDDTYSTEVAKLTKAKTAHCETTSDLTRLLCKISPELVLDTLTNKEPYIGKVSYGFVFDAGKLLKEDYYSTEFAHFLYELQYFKKLGCEWKTAIEYTGTVIKIIYFLPVSSFNIVADSVKEWLTYTRKKTFYSELARNEFENQFEAELKTRWNDIKKEIELHCKE